MTRRETDADAAAEAMAALAHQRRKEEAAHDAAMQKRAKRRVMLTAGEIAGLVYEAKKALELAERSSVTKEPRLRTDAINVAAGLKPLIKQLQAKIPEYASDVERGQGA